MAPKLINRPHLLACLLFYLSTALLVSAYNLDTQKALIKRGTKGSYFGYSIAQHATFDPPTQPQITGDSGNAYNSSFRSYVIVGAPRDEPSRLAGVVKPGAIYKCDFSSAHSCQLLDLDSLVQSSQSPNYQISNDQSTHNLPDDPSKMLLASAMDPVAQRDNQWLGVSVKSQGPNGYALACAHRYVLKGKSFRWGQGICYSFNIQKNLTLHRVWQPCLNRPVYRAHEEHGYCQAGTSGDISESADIVLGAPGPYTWRGTVFTNSINFGAKDDRTWYHAPMQDHDAKVDKYSYLGMSVVSGKFFNNRQYYVSGAPRAKEMGQVLFMTKRQSSYSRTPMDSIFEVDQILSGEHLAASFGYTLAKMDFNGDGLLDLVVSAPFYYSRHSKQEGGAVYLYRNDGKAVVPAGNRTGKPESQFGLALANCGDLNHDKYEDLAIGAPYDPHGGTVYIYLGSATGLRAEPSQIIKASSVSSNLQTFGYSLAGGMDMDLNGYPDLVVGSYKDDSVFILRARPIIEITTRIDGNLSRIDPHKSTCDGDTRNPLPCFKFNACFMLNPATMGDYSDSMKLKYRIEAETFNGQKFSRVKFQESEHSDAPNVVEKEILIEDYYKRMKTERCNAQRVYIWDRSDIYSPIYFKLTYTLVPPSQVSSSQATYSNRYSSITTNNQLISSQFSSTSSSSGDLNGLATPFPILNQEEAQRIFSASFLKDCGSNNICESMLDVDGQLQAPKETLGVDEPGYPTDKQINVTIRVANGNEPAYEAKLFVTHPTSIIYNGFKAIRQAVPVECESIDKGLIKCDLGNPMPRGSSKLMMIFNTQNRAGTFDFNLMVNTTSQNSKDTKTSFDLSVTIKKKSEIQIAIRQPPTIPEPTINEPPTWLLVLSSLLGILLLAALIYCLYLMGFFERERRPYMRAETEDGFR